ncbi:MAG: PDZ domain-containing protein [Phycisphaerales bacterium]
MRALIPALLLAASVAALPGCIIVHREIQTTPADSYTSASRTALGVYTERPDAATAAQLNLDRDRAALVTHVVPGSPAEKAGLQRYDVITAVNDQTDVNSGRLRELVRGTRPGDTVKVSYIRQGQVCETAAVVN